ncbi:MAG: ABC transporter ATP-binding protein [Candidatus Omnitrophica bacterium]|nr:ABC transporter ATP-binding protein [Candidatus Omnitrophota bacterium]
MTTYALEAKDLIVRYGKHEALRSVTLGVKKGETFGFIGPNGAGKSTFIKTALGLLLPHSGSVVLNGLAPGNTASRVKLGFVPEEANYYRYLTPEEILRFYGRIFKVPKVLLENRITELLTLVGLEKVRRKRASTFSKGMMQKISLAQALINDPDTLILDEPTSGLDPLAKLNLRSILIRLREQGKTLFFSSHELSEVVLLCDSMAILVGGRVMAEGPLKDVVGDSERNLERLFVQLVQGEKR